MTGSSGDRCTTLPNDRASFAATTEVPENALSITSVEMVGFVHPWAGDLQAVLVDPDGRRYNLFARPSLEAHCAAAGDSSDFGGDYVFVGRCGHPTYDLESEAGSLGFQEALPSGTYGQEFSQWTDGASGVANKDLSGIEVVAGIWTLEIYDGFDGSTGTLAEWRMHGTTRTTVSMNAPGGAIPFEQTFTTGHCQDLPHDRGTFPLTLPDMRGRRIESITLEGLQHTWVGDLQIVLESPWGSMYNIVARIDPATPNQCLSFGDSSDFDGNYTIVSAGTPAGDLLVAAANASPTQAIPSGTYAQYFGIWEDELEVHNIPLHEIPLNSSHSGTWRLLIYDGAVGDLGSLSSWSMTVSPVAEDVCPGEVNSTGVPSRFWLRGSTSVAADDLYLRVDRLPPGSFGYFLVGDECVHVPGLGGGVGTLCVGGDLRRGFGNAIVAASQSGTLWLRADLANVPTTGFSNPSGVAATPGQRLFLQYWHRDALGGVPTSNLSNAVLLIPTP